MAVNSAPFIFIHLATEAVLLGACVVQTCRGRAVAALCCALAAWLIAKTFNELDRA